MAEYYLKTPLKDADIALLNAGDTVYISGKIYTARDMAHYKLKKICDLGGELPEDFKGQVIFHAGPIINTEDHKHKLIAIGPTSSIRMDPYSDMMGRLGVKVLIGKGGMGEQTTEAMRQHTMVYLLAAHGCSAIHTQKITSVDNQHWMEEIGMPEALWVLQCKEFGPLIVGIDSKGRNLFEETKKNSREMVKAMSVCGGPKEARPDKYEYEE